MSISLTNIEPGDTGQNAISKINNAIEVIADLVDRQNTQKSAVVYNGAPLESEVAIGDLVYFNGTKYDKAKSGVNETAGVSGASIETASSHVEGIVVDIDNSNPSNVVGVLLICGFYESTAAMANCIGWTSSSDPSPGVYYLSSINAGQAVRDPAQGLRQPVLSYHGAGKFTFSTFGIAHDYHFHASCKLRGTWHAIGDLPSGVTAPTGAHYWYEETVNDPIRTLGYMTDQSMAVFNNGILQEPGTFFASGDYMWYTGNSAPGSNSVVIFNHYPFAYESPVVRSIESTSPTLQVRTTNGNVKLTPNAFINAGTQRSARAVASIDSNNISYTPVITGLAAGPGTSISVDANGIATVAAAYRLGLIDAYNINHNQTNVISDGKYCYILFPKNRSSSVIITLPVNDVPSTTTLATKVWCAGVGQGTSFGVSFDWTPDVYTGQTANVGASYVENSTLYFGGTSDARVVGYGETATALTINGSGLLTARITRGSENSDVRLLRVGFKLSIVSAAPVI